MTRLWFMCSSLSQPSADTIFLAVAAKTPAIHSAVWKCLTAVFTLPGAIPKPGGLFFCYSTSFMFQLQHITYQSRPTRKRLSRDSSPLLFLSVIRACSLCLPSIKRRGWNSRPTTTRNGLAHTNSHTHLSLQGSG